MPVLGQNSISQPSTTRVLESATSAIGLQDGSGQGIATERSVNGSQVRTRAVGVAEVIAKTTTQVSLVEDDDVVEEFASEGADHALGEWVLPRRARRGENLGDADALHASSKLATVDAVAIAEEEARR